MIDETSNHFTRLPDPEHPQRWVGVSLGQFHICLEEDQHTEAPTRIILSREQLLAFLVVLPTDYLHAALHVQAGAEEPFDPEKRDGMERETSPSVIRACILATITEDVTAAGIGDHPDVQESLRRLDANTITMVEMADVWRLISAILAALTEQKRHEDTP